MPNAYTSLPVPAGNGVAASVSFNDRTLRTFCVAGAFDGTVVIEVSDDEITWAAILTFDRPDFKTTTIPVLNVRVRRSNVPAGVPPGTPIVTCGSDAVATQAATPAPPATLNGAGAGENITDQTIQTIQVEGDFQNAGMVIHVEISQDLTSWVPACPTFTGPGLKLVPNLAANLVRQRVAGRTVAGTDPVVTVTGPEIPVCSEILTMPALNGPGPGVDVSECGADKTICVHAPGRDLPGRLLVEGSNDAGASWVPVVSFNTPGLRKVLAIFQQMRVTAFGFTAAVPGLSVGVGAPRAQCDTVQEGESNTDVSIGGV